MAEVKAKTRSEELKDIFTYGDWVKSIERMGISIQDYVNNTLEEWQNLGDTTFIPKDNANYGGTLTRLVYNTEGTLSRKNRVYITKVLYNNPATVVFWSDGTTTKNICPPDTLYNPDAGLAFCMLRKFMGNDKMAKLFADWELEDYKEDKNRWVELKDVRKKHKRTEK